MNRMKVPQTDVEVKKVFEEYQQERRELLMEIFTTQREQGKSAIEAYKFTLNAHIKAAENARDIWQNVKLIERLDRRVAS